MLDYSNNPYFNFRNNFMCNNNLTHCTIASSYTKLRTTRIFWSETRGRNGTLDTGTRSIEWKDSESRD